MNKLDAYLAERMGSTNPERMGSNKLKEYLKQRGASTNVNESGGRSSINEYLAQRQADSVAKYNKKETLSDKATEKQKILRMKKLTVTGVPDADTLTGYSDEIYNFGNNFRVGRNDKKVTLDTAEVSHDAKWDAKASEIKRVKDQGLHLDKVRGLKPGTTTMLEVRALGEEQRAELSSELAGDQFFDVEDRKKIVEMGNAEYPVIDVAHTGYGSTKSRRPIIDFEFEGQSYVDAKNAPETNMKYYSRWNQDKLDKVLKAKLTEQREQKENGQYTDIELKTSKIAALHNWGKNFYASGMGIGGNINKRVVQAFLRKENISQEDFDNMIELDALNEQAQIEGAILGTKTQKKLDTLRSEYMTDRQVEMSYDEDDPFATSGTRTSNPWEAFQAEKQILQQNKYVNDQVKEIWKGVNTGDVDELTGKVGEHIALKSSRLKNAWEDGNYGEVLENLGSIAKITLEAGVDNKNAVAQLFMQSLPYLMMSGSLMGFMATSNDFTMRMQDMHTEDTGRVFTSAEMAKATAYGVGAAYLDRLGYQAAGIAPAFKIFGKKIAGESFKTVDKLAMRAAKTTARVPAAGVTEAVTEGSQGVLEDLGAGREVELVKNLTEGAVGGLLGLGMAGGAGAVNVAKPASQERISANLDKFIQGQVEEDQQTGFQGLVEMAPEMDEALKNPNDPKHQEALDLVSENATKMADEQTTVEKTFGKNSLEAKEHRRRLEYANEVVANPEIYNKKTLIQTAKDKITRKKTIAQKLKLTAPDSAIPYNSNSNIKKIIAGVQNRTVSSEEGFDQMYREVRTQTGIDPVAGKELARKVEAFREKQRKADPKSFIDITLASKPLSEMTTDDITELRNAAAELRSGKNVDVAKSKSYTTKIENAVAAINMHNHAKTTEMVKRRTAGETLTEEEYSQIADSIPNANFMTKNVHEELVKDDATPQYLKDLITAKANEIAATKAYTAATNKDSSQIKIGDSTLDAVTLATQSAISKESLDDTNAGLGKLSEHLDSVQQKIRIAEQDTALSEEEKAEKLTKLNAEASLIANLFNGLRAQAIEKKGITSASAIQQKNLFEAVPAAKLANIQKELNPAVIQQQIDEVKARIQKVLKGEVTAPKNGKVLGQTLRALVQQAKFLREISNTQVPAVPTPATDEELSLATEENTEQLSMDEIVEQDSGIIHEEQVSLDTANQVETIDFNDPEVILTAAGTTTTTAKTSQEETDEIARKEQNAEDAEKLKKREGEIEQEEADEAQIIEAAPTTSETPTAVTEESEASETLDSNGISLFTKDTVVNSRGVEYTIDSVNKNGTLILVNSEGKILKGNFNPGKVTKKALSTSPNLIPDSYLEKDTALKIADAFFPDSDISLYENEEAQKYLNDPDFREMLANFIDQTAGWADVGGLLIRDAKGKAAGRTTWIPKQAYFAGKNPLDKIGHFEALAKLLRTDSTLLNKTTTARVRRIEFMLYNMVIPTFATEQEMDGEWDIDKTFNQIVKDKQKEAPKIHSAKATTSAPADVLYSSLEDHLKTSLKEYLDKGKSYMDFITDMRAAIRGSNPLAQQVLNKFEQQISTQKAKIEGYDLSTVTDIAEKVLIPFLKRYGFTVDIGDDLVMKLASKYAALDTRNEEQVAKAFSKIIARLSINVEGENAIFPALRKTKLFKQELQKARAASSKRTRKEVLEQEAGLASVEQLLQKGFQDEFIRRAEIPGNIIAKIKLLIRDIINTFSPLSNTTLNSIIYNHVENAFLRPDIYSAKPRAGFVKLDFQKAFKQSKIAADIMDKIGTLAAMTLTGSIAYTPQGDVWRSGKNPIHDLDFIVEGLNSYDIQEIVEKHFPEAKRIYSFPSTGWIDTFLIPPKGHQIINMERRANGLLVTQYDVADMGGNIKGSFRVKITVDPITNSIISREETKDGLEAMFVDFFSEQDYKVKSIQHPYTTQDDKTVSVNLNPYESGFGAKLEYGRVKDTTDFLLFEPKEEFAVTSDESVFVEDIYGVRELIEYLRKKIKDNPMMEDTYSELLDTLEDIVPLHLRITERDSPNKSTTPFHQQHAREVWKSLDFTNTVAWYSERHTIGFDLAAIKANPDLSIEEILLHELMHAAISRILTRLKNGESTPGIQKAHRKLELLRRHLVSNLPGEFSEELANVDEMLSYGMTQPAFRAALKNYGKGAKRNALQKIYDYALELIGMAPSKNRDVLAELYAGRDELLYSIGHASKNRTMPAIKRSYAEEMSRQINIHSAKENTGFTVTPSSKVPAAEKLKAPLKASLATQYIGHGPVDSSTYAYAKEAHAAGIAINSGVYDKDDVVFASITSRGTAAQVKELADKSIKEISLALDVGALVLLDSAGYIEGSSYNQRGEGYVAKALLKKGYVRKEEGTKFPNIGFWMNEQVREAPVMTNVWHGTNENAELSNLAKRPFTYEGKKYISVEHAYQTHKSGTFDTELYGKYKTAGTKIVGNKKANITNNWNVHLMEKLMQASFAQNPEVAKKLKALKNTTFTHTQDRGIWKNEFPRILKEIANTETKTTVNLSAKTSTYGNTPVDPFILHEKSNLMTSLGKMGDLGLYAWASAEGAYQASKLMYTTQEAYRKDGKLTRKGSRLLSRLSLADAATAKTLGKEITDTTEAWNERKGKIMQHVVSDRILADETSMASLLATNDTVFTSEEFPEYAEALTVVRDIMLTDRRNDRILLDNILGDTKGQVAPNEYTGLAARYKNATLLAAQGETATTFSLIDKYGDELFSFIPKGDSAITRLPGFFEYLEKADPVTQKALLEHFEISENAAKDIGILAKFKNSIENQLVNSVLGDIPTFKYLYLEGPINLLRDTKNKGVLPVQVIDAIALESMNWLGTKAGKTVTNDERNIRAILGLKDTDELSDAAVNALTDIGVNLTILAESLGKAIYKSAGITLHEGANPYIANRLQSDLGKLAIVSLSKIKDAKGEPIIKFTSVLNSELDMYRGKKDKYAEGTSVLFARVNSKEDAKGQTEVNPTVKYIIDFLKHSNVLDEVFGIASYENAPNTSPNPIVDTFIQDSATKVSAENASKMKHAQTVAWIPRASNTAIFKRMSKDGMLNIAGKVLDINAEHVMSRKGIQSNNNMLTRDYEDFEAYVNEQEGVPLYYDYKLISNSRMMVKNNMLNVQTSKFIRHMIGAKNWNVKVNTKDLRHQFFLTVAEALDITVDTDYDPNVIDEFHREVISKDGIVHPNYAAAVDLLRADSTESYTQEEEAIIIAAVSKGKGKTGSLDALIALGKYKTSLDRGESSFETGIFRETDGKTNGFASTILQLPRNNVQTQMDLQNRVGIISNEQPYESFADLMRTKEGFVDSYYDLGSEIVTQLNEIFKEYSPRQIALFNYFTLAIQDEEGNVTSEGRQFAKDPFMQNAYGAGVTGLKHGKAAAAVKSFYVKGVTALREGDIKAFDEWKQYHDAFATGKYKLGDKKFTLEEFLEYKAPFPVTQALHEFVAETTGTALKKALDIKLGSIKKDTGVINRALNVATAISVTYINEQLRKAEEDLGQPLTQAETNQLLKVYHAQGFTVGIRGHMAELGNFAEYTHVMKDEKVSVSKEDGGRTRTYFKKGAIEFTNLANKSGSQSSHKGLISKRELLSQVGVSGQVLLIQNTDSAVNNRLMGVGDMLNVYDAQGRSLADIVKFTTLSNALFIDVAHNWNLTDEVGQTLHRMQRLLSQFTPQMLQTTKEYFQQDMSPLIEVSYAKGQKITKQITLKDFIKRYDVFNQRVLALKKENAKTHGRVEQFVDDNSGFYPLRQSAADLFMNKVENTKEDGISLLDAYNKVILENQGYGESALKTLEELVTEVAEIDPMGSQSDISAPFSVLRTKPLNSAELTDLFDDLGKADSIHDSREHTELLKGHIDNLLAPMMDILSPANLQIGETDAENFGFQQGPYINVNISKSISLFGASMTPQEVFAHEMFHLTLKHGLRHDYGSRREMQRIFNQAVRIITPEHFLRKDADGNEILLKSRDEELTYAKKRYDHIFLNKENHLEEFASFALTNEAFSNALKNIAYRRTDKLTGSIWNMINQLVKNIINKIGQLDSSSKSSNLYDATVELAYAINAININTRRNFSGMVDDGIVKYSDMADQKLSALVKDHIIGSYNIKTREWLKNSKKGTVKRTATGLLTAPALILSPTPEEEIKKAELLRDFRRAHPWLEKYRLAKRGLVYQLYQEFVGPRTVIEREWHRKLSKVKHALDTGRKMIIDETANNVMNAYSTKLSKEDSRHLTKGLLNTGADVLFDGPYSIADIANFYTNKKAQQAEIKNLESQLDGLNAFSKFYKYQAASLGLWMTKGYTMSNATFFSVAVIADMHGTHNAKPVNADKALPIIDKLTTLHAISHLEYATASATAKIILEEEATGPENGVQYSTELYAMLQQEALESNFDNNPYSMIKGYIKEKYDSMISAEMAAANDTELLAQGYEQRYILPNAENDTRSGQRALYVNEAGLLRRYQAGLVSTTGKVSKGNGLFDIGLRDEDAKATFKEMLTDMHTDIAKQISGEMVASFDENMLPPVHTSPVISPITGKATDFRYTMLEKNKEIQLGMDNQIHRTLGRMAGNTYDKTNTKDLNASTVESLYDDFAQNGHKELDEFIEIGEDSTGKDLEYWRMLPDEMQRAIQNKFHKKAFFIRKNMINTILGYRKVSLIDKLKSLLKSYGVPFNATVEKIFRHISHLWEELVKVLKRNVVILTPVVFIANVVSNFIISLTSGVPPMYLLRKQAEAVSLIKSHVKWQAMQIKYENLLRTKTLANRGAIEIKLARVKKNLEYSPIKKLVDAGMYQSIVEDITLTDMDEGTLMPAVANLVPKGKTGLEYKDKFIEHPVGSKVKGAFDFMTLQPNTALGGLLTQATQMSDFVARYAMYSYFTQEKGMDEQEVMDMVMDYFIDYEVNTAPEIQWLNDKGILMYTKFLFRIQRMIIRQFAKTPARAIGSEVIQNELSKLSGYDPDDISESFILGKLGVERLTSPMEVLEGVFRINILNYPEAAGVF